MIGVIDYGAGNLKSISGALTWLGFDYSFMNDPKDISRSNFLLLPGVGSFGNAVEQIDRLNLRTAILEHVHEGGKLLGICLGMQLLFESSEESPGARGLGIIPGKVVKSVNGPLGTSARIGWDSVTFLSSNFDSGQYFFAHSFEVKAENKGSEIAFASRDNRKVTAAVGVDKVMGLQFHPEKSSILGLETLKKSIGALTT